jgi:hypothetical protein
MIVVKVLVQWPHRSQQWRSVSQIYYRSGRGVPQAIATQVYRYIDYQQIGRFVSYGRAGESSIQSAINMLLTESSIGSNDGSPPKQWHYLLLGLVFKLLLVVNSDHRHYIVSITVHYSEH